MSEFIAASSPPTPKQLFDFCRSSTKVRKNTGRHAGVCRRANKNEQIAGFSLAAPENASPSRLSRFGGEPLDSSGQNVQAIAENDKLRPTKPPGCSGHLFACVMKTTRNAEVGHVSAAAGEQRLRENFYLRWRAESRKVKLVQRSSKSVHNGRRYQSEPDDLRC